MYTSTVGAHVTSCLTVLFVECAHGFVPSDTINLYGPSLRNEGLRVIAKSKLYLFPSMRFSCDGTITDIRMRMDFVEGLQSGVQSQEVVVYFLLFHDGLNSPTRRVTHILLNQTNTRQELPNEIWTNRDPLSLPVTAGSFIGFAVPENRSPTMHTKNINFSGSDSELVEVHISSQLTVPFSVFECTGLAVARKTDSNQFSSHFIPSPLIDVSFSK